MPRVVRDEQPAGAGVALLTQQAQHLIGRLGIERPGWFVGQHQPPIPDECTRDGDPLLLTAGHVLGESVRQLGDAEFRQPGKRFGAGCLGLDPVELARERDVLRGREGGDEVELLEHVAQMPSPDRRTFVC
jgi:hypothetical protein